MGTGKHLNPVRRTCSDLLGAAFSALFAALLLAVTGGHCYAQSSSSDPLASAGTLLNECTALNKSAAPICSSLSTAVANGHDPSLNLPTVKSVKVGDLHISGPWKSAIVVRKTILGHLKAYAVAGSGVGSPNVAVATIDNAAQAQASNQAAAGGAQNQTAPSSNPVQFEEGWVTEVHPELIPDGTVISPAVITEYISNNPSVHYLGEYADTIPVHTDYVNAEYTWRGLFKVDEAGDYRFAVTFVPAQLPVIDSWECFAHLDFIDAGNRIAALPDDPVDFDTQTPPARIKNLISGHITMPAGLNELQLEAVCNPGQKWDFSRLRRFAAAESRIYPY